MFAEKEERPVHMIERLENRICTVERQVQGLQCQLERVGNVLTDISNTATCVDGKVNRLDKLLQEIIRRELELMDMVLEYSKASQAST